MGDTGEEGLHGMIRVVEPPVREQAASGPQKSVKDWMRMGCVEQEVG